MTDLLVVIPVLNEADSLSRLTEELRTCFGATCHWRICIVDDGSTDATWATVGRLTQSDPRITGIRLSRNFGKDAAILAGLSQGPARAFIVMDGDGQHPPRVAKEMYDRWQAEGWDVLNGLKRRRTPDGIPQRVAAAWFNAIFRRLSGIDLANGCDFKLLSERVVTSLLSCQERDFFFRAMVAWIGFRQTTVPFDVEARIAGERSWSIPRLVHYAGSVLVQHSSLPLTFIFSLGLFSLAGSSVLLCKVIVQYVFSSVPAGYSTLIVLLLVSLSVNVIVAGVLGLYIRKIFEQSNNRPRFIVEAALDLQAPRSQHP